MYEHINVVLNILQGTIHWRSWILFSRGRHGWRNFLASSIQYWGLGRGEVLTGPWYRMILDWFITGVAVEGGWTAWEERWTTHDDEPVEGPHVRGAGSPATRCDLVRIHTHLQIEHREIKCLIRMVCMDYRLLVVIWVHSQLLKIYVQIDLNFSCESYCMILSNETTLYSSNKLALHHAPYERNSTIHNNNDTLVPLETEVIA